MIGYAFLYGTKLFGKVDRDDGTHVATQFFHVNYVPIAPVKSYVIDGDRAAEIPRDGRSVALGYVRGWGFVTTALLTLFGYLQHQRSGSYVLPAAAVAMLVATCASWLFIGIKRRSGARWIVSLLGFAATGAGMGIAFADAHDSWMIYEPERERAAQAAAAERDAPALLAARDAYGAKLRVVAEKIRDDKDKWEEVDCDRGAIEALLGGDADPIVPVFEYGLLAKKFGFEGERGRSSAWIVSRPFKALFTMSASDLDRPLGLLAKRPLVGVFYTVTDEYKKTVKGWMMVFDLEGGRMLGRYIVATSGDDHTFRTWLRLELRKRCGDKLDVYADMNEQFFRF